MQDIQPQLIEKYQMLLEKDPKSQVFAPLSEAYRKMNMIEEAHKICVRGVKYNPNFAGGRIALSRVLMDQENIEGAVEELSKATELSPDNILAHSLLGECHLLLKAPKSALRSFKMVLFLSPNNEKALRAVKKLESLTADEFDDELFQMRKLPAAFNEETTRIQPLGKGHVGSEKIQSLERYLSLIDAYIVRNDMDRAWNLVKEGEKYHSGSSELQKRARLIQSRSEEEDEPEAKPAARAPAPKMPTRQELQRESRIRMLQDLLSKVRSHSQFTD